MQRNWSSPVPQTMQRHSGGWNPMAPKSPANGAAVVTPEAPAPANEVTDPPVDQTVRLASVP